MTGKRLLGAVIASLGVVVLIASAAAAAPAAKKGGTIVVEMTTDVDYIDPQLSYYGETWKLEAATACKLLNWPDKEGRRGAVGDARGRGGPAADLDRRQDLHVHDPLGLPLLERQGRNGQELRGRVQPLREPEDAVDRRPVPRHHPGRPGGDRRQGEHGLRASPRTGTSSSSG